MKAPRSARARCGAALALLFALACGPAPRSSAALTGVTIASTTPHFGFAVCTAAPLHDCIGRIPERSGTRVTPAVDIAAGCSTEAAAASACPGSSNAADVQRCYAEHGVLIDLFGVVDPALPTYPSHFSLECQEGIGGIDFIEPF